MGAKMEQMELFGDLDARDLVPPPLSVEPEPDMVRVAPGRHAWVPKRAATPPPEYVVCRWSQQADGTWAPVPVAGRYVRLDSSTATLLGFPARAVADGTCDRGVVICTTGIGVSIAANKVPGIRCALCTDSLQAEMTRRHNDANVLALGAGITGPNLAKRMLELFLNTEFEGGRHARRVALLDAIR